MTRRDFLEFLGRNSFVTSALVAGCSNLRQDFSIPRLMASQKDILQTVPGLHFQIIVKAYDPISKSDTFGDDNDFLAYLPFHSATPDEGYLWVNHEIFHPQFLNGWTPQITAQNKTRERTDLERYQVGGSLLHIKKTNHQWKLVQNSLHTRRYTALTPIPFSNDTQVAGTTSALGTLANCCGGLTPWGTFLSCEENYHQFYGESDYNPKSKKYEHKKSNLRISWSYSDPRPPEHYGWVNEINPRTGSIIKLVALGRFAHEGATVVQAPDGRSIVYMGDDAENEHFYKFISEQPGSLDKGTLYAADFEMGRWLPLVRDLHPQLKERFKDQTELLIRAREAAKILGATPLDRPEDCEVDPVTKQIFLSCTNNKNNPHGHILKIKEKNNDFLSLNFESETFLKGGPETGFSSPDNLAFDKNGNLWMVTDRAEDADGKNIFGNNALFFIPTHGPQAGQAHRIAIGPVESELTGLHFAPDNETLFVSVQHPGGKSPGGDPSRYTSHWPEGGLSVPRSAVVALSGPTMKRLLNLKA